MTETELERQSAYTVVWPTLEPADLIRLRAVTEQVAGLDGDPGVTGKLADAHRIDQLRSLEQLKAVAASAQARITVAFDKSQLAQQDAAGVRREARGRGIGDQVALARGCPTSQGSRHLGFAKAMTEMPHTLALLTRGEIEEWTATILVKETAIATLVDRKTIDQRLCAMSLDTTTGEITDPLVTGWTPRRAEAAARAMVAELDPQAAVRRASKAAGDRRVTIRPTPDTMTYVTGLLPVAQGVAVWANLSASAKAIKASGDERTVSQIMADLFTQRLTGQSDAEAVPVEIQLVMTPDSLLGASDQPARIGDTVVPAQTARDLATRPDAPRWLRRLFTDQITGVVTDVDPKRRLFKPADARFIGARDQHCRFSRCDGGIDDRDHVVRVADDGRTTRVNGQGLCEGHNLVKEIPGWTTRVADPRPSHHTVLTTTPTGHRYRSRAPSGLPPPPR